MCGDIRNEIAQKDKARTIIERGRQSERVKSKLTMNIKKRKLVTKPKQNEEVEGKAKACSNSRNEPGTIQIKNNKPITETASVKKISDIAERVFRIRIVCVRRRH